MVKLPCSICAFGVHSVIITYSTSCLLYYGYYKETMSIIETIFCLIPILLFQILIQFGPFTSISQEPLKIDSWNALVIALKNVDSVSRIAFLLFLCYVSLLHHAMTPSVYALLPCLFLLGLTIFQTLYTFGK